MKRILLFLAFVLTCSVSYAQKTWKVGDFYDVNGKQGVVFWVASDGMHGKIISLYQTYTPKWEEAKKWCSNLGSGWRLPSKGELLYVQKMKNTINQALSTIGNMIGEVIDEINGEKQYWSSTVDASGCAWFVDMSDGNTGNLNWGDYYYYVRAVSAF